MDMASEDAGAAYRRATLNDGPLAPHSKGRGLTATQIAENHGKEVQEDRIEKMFAAAAAYRLAIIHPIEVSEDVRPALDIIAKDVLSRQGLRLASYEPLYRLADYNHRYDRPEEQRAIIMHAQFLPAEPQPQDVTIDRSEVKGDDEDR